jgi:ADP-heptose:LPS heptosyltransferase
MPARTYAWQQYAEAIDLLVDRLDARVVLTGDASELELVDRLWRSLKSTTQERVRPCAGALSFPELCALIEVSDLMVTNNTGPMHIAAAVKTPTVALFALTNPPEQWGPWRVASTLLYQDVPCRLCYSRICPYGHECLRLVTPATVADAAAELLDRAAGASGSLELIG